MKAPKHSLRKIVTFLNNEDEDGGFWLPNIQRPFVWSEEQICRLFDSILREYPISTLLIWKTKSEIRHRKFIDNYYPNPRLEDLYRPSNDKKKCLVLDGQQRLQSLFIGLCGSYEGRELYLDVLSGEVAAPDDIKYHFAFLDSSKAAFPWVKFRDLVFSNENIYTAGESIIALSETELNPEEKAKVNMHIAIVFQAFHTDEGISYQELDSIENPKLYTEDDIVEVFIRANSGGTRLGKSDLLFSLLSSSWDEADIKMSDLLQDLNHSDFDFTRDFVLKTCLTLLNMGARYEVSKFRKEGVRESIENNWDKISHSLMSVLEFIEGKTYIRCDKAMPSYLVLIPLIYANYYHSDAWESTQDIDKYIVRTLLTGAFSGTPDQLIDDCVSNIKESKKFDVASIFDVIRNKGRSLVLTEEKLFGMGYDSKSIHLLFNLWYREFNYSPAFENKMPQIDHIFPQSALKKIKLPNPTTGKMNIIKYKSQQRNQLANCMLLTREENGAGGKGAMLPEKWFADKPEEYLDMHLIPKNKELWVMDKFEDFIVERQKLILDKFNYLIAKKLDNGSLNG